VECTPLVFLDPGIRRPLLLPGKGREGPPFPPPPPATRWHMKVLICSRGPFFLRVGLTVFFSLFPPRKNTFERRLWRSPLLSGRKDGPLFFFLFSPGPGEKRADGGPFPPPQRREALPFFLSRGRVLRASSWAHFFCGGVFLFFPRLWGVWRVFFFFFFFFSRRGRLPPFGGFLSPRRISSFFFFFFFYLRLLPRPFFPPPSQSAFPLFFFPSAHPAKGPSAFPFPGARNSSLFFFRWRKLHQHRRQRGSLFSFLPMSDKRIRLFFPFFPPKDVTSTKSEQSAHLTAALFPPRERNFFFSRGRRSPLPPPDFFFFFFFFSSRISGFFLFFFWRWCPEDPTGRSSPFSFYNSSFPPPSPNRPATQASRFWQTARLFSFQAGRTLLPFFFPPDPPERPGFLRRLFPPLLPTDKPARLLPFPRGTASRRFFSPTKTFFTRTNSFFFCAVRTPKPRRSLQRTAASPPFPSPRGRTRSFLKRVFSFFSPPINDVETRSFSFSFFLSPHRPAPATPHRQLLFPLPRSFPFFPPRRRTGRFVLKSSFSPLSPRM